MRKYIFIIALALLAIPALTSCDTETKEEPGGTAIEKMCGYWDVSYDAVDENGEIVERHFDVLCNKRTFLTLVQRYKELFSGEGNGGGGTEEVPFET